MPTCPAEETVIAFVEDRLRPAQRATLEAHAAGCDACSSLIAAVTTAWFTEGKLAGGGEPARPAFAEGERVGPYTIVARAGSGSMGDVYRARDDRLGRDVALKTLPARFAKDPDRLARFRQEARAAGALSHSNLLTLHDVGTHEGIPYLVTEWLEGTTLRDRLAGGALAPRLTLQLGLQLARGLVAAHDKGIVHRDLKPANISIGADGTCKFLDFGLAKLAETMAEGESTQPGVLIGTAGYMAPEQVRGHVVDHRADLFALGAVLHEMATGRPPFGGATAVDRMSATLRDEPAPVPSELGSVIARCLAKDPRERFQSARDLVFCLESLGARGEADSDAARPHVLPSSGSGPGPLDARPTRSRRAGITAAITIAIAGVAIVAFAAKSALFSPRVEPEPLASPSASPAERPTYRPLTFRRGQVLSARFSADGHTVLYGAAWDGGPADIFTARAEGPGSRSLGVAADVLAVSPRGELAILLDPKLVDPDHATGTLARMPLGGGAPRAMADHVQEADWDPGGAELAVVREIGGRFRLEHPIGSVRYETEGWISHARVAPRGNRIAFLLHPNPKDDRGSVMVLEGDGAPRELAADWASARGLAWAPGGEEIWFTASKADADYSLLAVDLKGSVRLVDRVPGRLVLHDIAADGKALLDHQATRMGLVFGRKGGEAERKGGEAERELTWADSSFLTDMTPDGRFVVFAEAGASEGPSYGAYMRATDGAPPVRLGDGLPLAISPDGKRVLSMRYGERLDFTLLPTGAGEPQPLALTPLDVVLNARWFPDGKRILLRASEAGRLARLWVHEIGAPGPRAITPEGTAPVFAISPDGARLAGIDGGALRIFSATGQELGVVPGRFPDQDVVGWDRAGEAVYLRTETVPARVSRVELSTGESRLHLTMPAGSVRAGLASLMMMTLSEDGLAYAYTYYEVFSRLYLVQGLTAR